MEEPGPEGTGPDEPESGWEPGAEPECTEEPEPLPEAEWLEGALPEPEGPWPDWLEEPDWA